jgi:hypothetical protein
MWLKEKSVSTLSEFLSDAKLSTDEMQQFYKIKEGSDEICNAYRTHSI